MAIPSIIGASIIAGGTAYIVNHIINPGENEQIRNARRDYQYDERVSGRPMHK